jgi:hypothetical protein
MLILLFYTRMPQRLIFYMTICVALGCISNLFSFTTYDKEDEFPNLCYAQGFLGQFFFQATFLWMVFIALNLYLVVVQQRRNLAGVERAYHIATWFLASIVTILPTTTGSYGAGPIWCWINEEDMGRVWRIVVYIPIYIYLVVIIALYWKIIRSVRASLKNRKDNLDEGELKRASNMLARLQAYPLIIVVLYIFPTINRMNSWFGGSAYFSLYILHVVTAPMLGFANSLAYGFDHELRTKYQICWKKNCLKQQVEEEEEHGISELETVNTKEGDSMDSVQTDF